MLAITLPIAIPTIANAAQEGAFEMDAKYYLRYFFPDAMQSKGGVMAERLKALRKTPIYKSPRTIDENLSKKALFIVEKEISKLSGLKIEELQTLRKASLPYYLNYFKKFVPIVKDDLTDQYYYDIILFVTYLEAGKVLVTSEQRVELRKCIGEKIFDEIIQSNNILSNTKSIDLNNKMNSSGLSNESQDKSSILSERLYQSSMCAHKIKPFCLDLIQILQYFQSTQFIKEFIFDFEDLDDEIFAYSSFNQGLPISFQIILKEPITLLGFLEQSKANTFFHPDIIGTTLTCLGRRYGYDIRFEDYLMDNYYRDENFDIQAQDILLEFILKCPTK